MKRLDAMMHDYSTGEVSLEQFSSDLMEFIFRNPKKFCLERYSEDDFSDILIYLRPKFEQLIERYSPEKASFSSYFAGCVYTMVYWWRKKRDADKVISRCSTEIACEINRENVMRNAEYEDSLQFASCDDSVPLEVLEKKADRTLGYNLRFHGNPFRSRKRDGDEVFLKEMCLILALKSCMQIEPSMISRIALLAGMDSGYFSDLVLKAKESIEPKIRVHESIGNRANYSYFCRKRNGVMELDSFRRDEMWHDCIRKLSASSVKLVPSNKTVAGLLGITSRRVGYVMSRLSQNVDNLKVKCYSLTHENLFGNRKPEQKTRNFPAFPGAHRRNPQGRGH